MENSNDSKDDNSNDGILNDSIGGPLDEPTQLGNANIYIKMIKFHVFCLEMMNGLDEVGGFEDSLMNELDSDLMNIDTDADSNCCIMQHMDIREPLSKLKKLLEQRLGLELPGFQFCLQGSQIVSKLHAN